MRFIFLAATIMCAVSFFSPNTARAANFTDVCNFSNHIVSKNFGKAQDIMDAWTPAWSEESKKSLVKVMGFLKDSDADGFKLYELMNLDGDMIDVLVDFRSKRKGPTYTRFYLERVSSGYQLAYIDLNSSFRKIAEWPINQQPKLTSCK